MRGALAAVVLLVVLAGCQSVGPAGPTPTVTVTPAPYVPVPGLSVSGVEDVDRLANAHERSLRSSSYTVRMNLTFRRPNGSILGGTVTRITVGTAHERFWLRSRTYGEYPFDGTAQPAIQAWSNGTTTYLRRSHPDRVVYRAYDTADTGWDEAPPDGGTIRTYLGMANRSTVSEIRRSGERRYRVNATDGSRSVRAVVHPSGFVQSFTAVGPAASPVRLHIDGTATFTVQYDAVGEAEVGRPPWLGEAIRKTRNQTYVGQG